MDSNHNAIVHLMKCLKLKQDGTQFICDLPSHLARAAGILKYRRESADYMLTIVPQSQVILDYQITCEYCGKRVSPSLNLIMIYDSETDPVFCCHQWQQLCELLIKIRCLFDGKSKDSSEKEQNDPNRDLVYQKRMEKLSKLFMDTPKENKSDLNKDYLFEAPVQEAGATGSKALNFRLSCQPEEYWATFSENQGAKGEDFLEITLKKDMEEPFSIPFCGHTTLEFGLCHHQDGSHFVRHYSDGLKFLSVFDDGSAQVFYPSGLLAVMVVATKEHGRACIVYEDTPGQHIRALFQSDGKGSCYHGNGNIWMTINKYGGQCLDPEGTRVRRWKWDTRNSFRPIFLPINKSTGLRVLGKEQVFVSFFARGQQAKFNVGAWCHMVNCKVIKDSKSTSIPTFLKEDLIDLVYRNKIHRLIQHLHQCLATAAHPKLPNAALPRHLRRAQK